MLFRASVFITYILFGPKFTRKRLKKKRTRVYFFQMRERSSLVCLKQCFVLPLIKFEWCVRFITKEGFHCW